MRRDPVPGARGSGVGRPRIGFTRHREQAWDTQLLTADRPVQISQQA